MTGTRKFIMPDGHFKTSPGVHQYAIAATTASEIRRKTDEFQMKVFNAGGRILDEQKRRMPQGYTYILFTYKI